jgi:hypothetical protein
MRHYAQPQTGGLVPIVRQARPVILNAQRYQTVPLRKIDANPIWFPVLDRVPHRLLPDRE